MDGCCFDLEEVMTVHKLALLALESVVIGIHAVIAVVLVSNLNNMIAKEKCDKEEKLVRRPGVIDGVVVLCGDIRYK